ncbi:MAG TPA: hypothetical protein VGP47_06055 [Parachlamydiaceae bacterium]|nr:hypothetical protein [Parachlamydiaceae bacterium]
MTQDQSKHEWDILNPNDQKLLQESFVEFKLYPDRIQSENHQLFQNLKYLVEKYPNNPIPLNHLKALYLHIGRIDKAHEMIIEAYERFPYYLFAKAARANLYLLTDEIEKFLEVYGEAQTLTQLYPHREVFHIDEVKALHGSLLQYYCQIGNLTCATNQYEFLEKIMIQLGIQNDPDFLNMQTAYWDLVPPNFAKLLV